MERRLAIFWFLFLGGWGIFFPYYSLYLGQELGLSGTRVGLVMAMFPLVAMAAQPLWGHLADHTGSRRKVLATLAAGSALFAFALVAPRGFASALAGTAVLAVFSTSVLPMATSVSLAAVGRSGIARFGHIRMWGTIGFLVSVVAFPWLLERLSSTNPDTVPWHGLAWMFPATAVLALAAAVVAFYLPEGGELTLRAVPGDVRRLLAHPPVVRLLVLVFAAHLFMQGTINLFPLYVTDRGGDASTVGRMWIFMLLLEIPLIGFSGRTLKKIGARGLLTAGLAAEALRWTTCALTHDFRIIAAVQVMHGVSVAGVLLGAPLYLEQVAPERLRSTGQAFVATVSFGAGAILSNAGCGWLLEHLGPSAPYAVAGTGTLVLALLVHRVLPEPHPAAET